MQLNETVNRLERLLAETTMHRLNVDEQVTTMNRRIAQEHAAYMSERSQVDTAITSGEPSDMNTWKEKMSNDNNVEKLRDPPRGFSIFSIFSILLSFLIFVIRRFQRKPREHERKRAEQLQEIGRRWQVNRQELEQQLLRLKRTSNQSVSCTADYEKQIDTHNTTISNIRTELSQPQQPVDKGLVKPARGFIMYGPPGTYCFSYAHFLLRRSIVFRYGQIGNHEQAEHQIGHRHGRAIASCRRAQ